MSSQRPGKQPLPTYLLEVAVIKGDFDDIGEWNLAVRQGEAIPGSDQS